MSSTSSNWLENYLVKAAIVQNLCTNVSCTTCGARPFRDGLLQACALVLDQGTVRLTGAAPEIVTALSRLPDPEMYVYGESFTGLKQDELPLEIPIQTSSANQQQLAAAVRLILYDLWNVMDHAMLEKQLRESWAGHVLEGMQAHHEALQNAQRARQQWEAGAQERREEKRRLRQEQHAARLAEKIERDRQWHSQHASGNTEKT